MTAPPPLPTLERAAVRRLRAFLDRTGFGAAAVRSLLQSEDAERLLHRGDLPVHRRRLADAAGALPLVVRLLVLEDTVRADELEQRLGDALDLLVETGLVHERGGTMESTVRVVPHDDVLVASDRQDARTGEQHVAGVHGPSATLAHLTVRRGVERALDVGTGNGIQALLLARHAERVVATDVNERALVLAEFNAALNGVDNVELRLGSFLEPVEGERFGLAVANPPYVVSPESTLLFRDSELPGDTVSAELVAAVPRVLDAGGFATVMVSWVASGGDVTERPRAWLAGADCDAWILHTGTKDPLGTAADWNRDLRGEPEAYDAAITRWLDYYRAEGIESLAYGAIVLRRGSSSGWIRSTSLPGTPRRPAGPQLERMFAGQDVLRGLSDDQLLATRVRLVPSVRLEQLLGHDGAAWKVRGATLVLLDGLGFRGDLDETATRLLLELDSGVPLRDVVRRAGTGADGERAAAELVRGLVELGFAELDR